jgi:hypothetical protein
MKGILPMSMIRETNASTGIDLFAAVSVMEGLGVLVWFLSV